METKKVAYADFLPFSGDLSSKFPNMTNLIERSVAAKCEKWTMESILRGVGLVNK